MRKIFTSLFITCIVVLGPVKGSAQVNNHPPEPKTPGSSPDFVAPPEPKIITAAGSDPNFPALIIAEQMPEFPGGMGEMQMFIQKETRFPKNRLEDSLFSGCRSYLKMIIDTSGKVINPVVIKNCAGCPECDAEALRVLKAMPLWHPGRQNGRKVNVYYSIPVSFKRN